MPAVPLMAGWTLSGSGLPERLRAGAAGAPAFFLPGEAELAAFADLLGEPDAGRAAEGTDGVAYALPALLPQDMPGPAALAREIDFGAFSGDRAFICFDLLCGRGEALLAPCKANAPELPVPAPERLGKFSSGPLMLDVTDALRRGLPQRLTLRFDAARPAGVPAPVFLRLVRGAQLERVRVVPDVLHHTLTLRADITALRAGNFVLRAQLCPAKAPDAEHAPPAREIAFSLSEGQAHRAQLALEAPGEAFVPGKPYDAPALKVSLFLRPAQSRKEAPPGQPEGLLCDGMSLLCGYPGAPARYDLPLTARECVLPPERLMSRLLALHVPGVWLPLPAPDALYRALTRSGIAVRQAMPLRDEERERLCRLPCVTFESAPSARTEPVSPAASAWQLCGATAYPPAPPPDLTPADLLAEAAGHPVDPQAPGTAGILAWLRAYSVRLRAEAARQGRMGGALCAPGEWDQPDVEQALRTALAPLHLSALPQRGAWWTGTRFSASLYAFVPADAADSPLRAKAWLEDAEGHVLARTQAACPAHGGALGLLEATLPDAPCVLELNAQLLSGGQVVEQSTLPVYVGERGPLEAAL